MTEFILTVEDNVSDGKMIFRALRKEQIPVDSVLIEDGAEALDYLFGTGAYKDRQLHKLPLFMLLDLGLPNVSGLEVLQYIRAQPRTQLLPVVVFTSSRERSDIVNSYSLGANSYVTKPIDSEEYMQIVQQTGSYWSRVNKVPHAST